MGKGIDCGIVGAQPPARRVVGSVEKPDRRPVCRAWCLPDALCPTEGLGRSGKQRGAALMLWRRENPTAIERGFLLTVDGHGRSFTRRPAPGCEGLLGADSNSRLSFAEDDSSEVSRGIIGLVEVRDPAVRQGWLRPSMRVVIEGKDGSCFAGVVHACDADGLCLRTPDGFMDAWCYPERIGARLWVQFMGNTTDRLPNGWDGSAFTDLLRSSRPDPEGEYPDIGQRG